MFFLTKKGINMTSKKQDSGRTMLEMIAVLILVGIITLSGVFGFSWLVQRAKKQENAKHVNTVIAALQNSRIIRKSNINEPISIKSVVSGPKTTSSGEVMILSEEDGHFMVVTAMGLKEYIVDLQIEPGTCAEYINAFSEYSAVFKTGQTSKIDSATDLLQDIKQQNKKAATFAPLSSATIQNCETTGRFRAAFNVSGRTDAGEEGKVYLYDTPDEDTPAEFHKCPSDKKEDANGKCCSEMCGNLCECPSDRPYCSANSCVECTSNDHCDGGRICQSNACVCDSSSGKIWMASECVCNKGEYENAGTCTPCAVGTYKDWLGNDTCTACAVGKYQDEIGQTSCKDCDGGQITTRTGATASTDCVCPEDKPKWNSTSEQCEACPANSEWSGDQCQCKAGYTLKDGTCQACDTGTYKSSAGNTACDACPKGYYQDKTGQTSCTSCGTNQTTSNTGATASTQCVCNAGYTLNGTTCQQCAKGTYKSSAGNTACDACPKGYYQDKTGQTRCEACGANQTTSNTGATASTQCISCTTTRTYTCETKYGSHESQSTISRKYSNCRKCGTTTVSRCDEKSYEHEHHFCYCDGSCTETVNICQ